MISEHITLNEAIKSPTALRLGIINIPDATAMSNMRTIAAKCFEPLRKWYGKPININSFFRCKELNVAIGGALNSQHMKGEAIDMSAGNKIENKKIFDWCKENLIFDQLINEYDYTWIHISFRVLANRNQTVIIK